jgi:hypothetical protein
MKFRVPDKGMWFDWLLTKSLCFMDLVICLMVSDYILHTLALKYPAEVKTQHCFSVTIQIKKLHGD